MIGFRISRLREQGVPLIVHVLESGAFVQLWVLLLTNSLDRTTGPLENRYKTVDLSC